MKKTVAFITALVVSIIPFTQLYAAQHEISKELNYHIKITANDNNGVVPFSGSYLITQNNGAKLVKLNEVTPYELSTKSDIIAFMLIADHEVKFDLSVKNNGAEQPQLSATGSVIFAHKDAYGTGYIAGQ